MNRCIRDPYVQWCESLSLSVSTDGAGYSISGWRSIGIKKWIDYAFIFFGSGVLVALTWRF